MSASKYICVGCVDIAVDGKIQSVTIKDLFNAYPERLAYGSGNECQNCTVMLHAVAAVMASEEQSNGHTSRHIRMPKIKQESRRGRLDTIGIRFTDHEQISSLHNMYIWKLGKYGISDVVISRDVVHLIKSRCFQYFEHRLLRSAYLSWSWASNDPTITRNDTVKLLHQASTIRFPVAEKRRWTSRLNKHVRTKYHRSNEHLAVIEAYSFARGCLDVVNFLEEGRDDCMNLLHETFSSYKDFTKCLVQYSGPRNSKDSRLIRSIIGLGNPHWTSRNDRRQLLLTHATSMVEDNSTIYTQEQLSDFLKYWELLSWVSLDSFKANLLNLSNENFHDVPPDVESFEAPLVEVFNELDDICVEANKVRTNIPSVTKENERRGDDSRVIELVDSGPHILAKMDSISLSIENWKSVQNMLPEAWKWDVEYHTSHSDLFERVGSWTCTPLEPDEPSIYPLTIAETPLVLPVEYQWPPSDGVTPPPDPHPAAPIDCRAKLSSDLVRDILLTFEGSIGFYILINGLLQILVPDDFDTAWASSHLPHKYGGLKVCYIEQTLEPTMLPSTTETGTSRSHSTSLGTPSDTANSFRSTHPPGRPLVRGFSLKLNDSIEARPLSNHRREKYAGRIGLQVMREGDPFVVMSTHIITEAILAKSHRDAMLGRGRSDRLQKLSGEWNDHTEIYARDRKIGTIDKTFDREAGVYPDGFNHDVTLIKPTSPTMVKDILSLVAGLGWLNQDSWALLRQQTTTVKILADTESTRSGKSIKCSCPSEVLVVGEGIFLNQKAAAGGLKNLKDHDASTWKELVSRALLYRVYPDFDPPNGHSGTTLYANGVREDGTEGPGVVGFQSFVQRSGHVQNFEMEGSALERRLQLGRVAFYGAFEVPAELKQYDIV